MPVNIKVVQLTLLQRVVLWFVGLVHLGEGCLVLARPAVYAVRLGHDGVVLSRVFGILSALLGAACINYAVRRALPWVVHATLWTNLTCATVFASDVFLSQDSGYTRSSFGFMMLVHFVCFMWTLVTIID